MFLCGMHMRNKTYSKVVVAVVTIFFLISLLSRTCSAQNYERRFFLSDGHSTYRLTLSITPSLYQYYQQKSHYLTPNNFATFVTPYSLELVADDIRSIFAEDEDLVNAVLMLVHQIPYQTVEGAKYPVETIVENRGDCDLLSYIAASLIKAEDIDIVLFYYEQESHMNIGVYLSSPPTDARMQVTYVDYRGTRYYIAECTGDDWRDGWRVGECPSELEGAQLTVVTLEDWEQIAPGQVSSSFGLLESSAISMIVSPSFVLEGSAVTISGEVSASSPNGTITLYAAANSDWFSLGTTELDSNGHYMFSWNPQFWGQYHVKASWSGDAEHAGADSKIALVIVVPKLVVFAGAGAIIAIIVVIVLSIMYKTTRPQETRTPEDPVVYTYSHALL